MPLCRVLHARGFLGAFRHHLIKPLKPGLLLISLKLTSKHLVLKTSWGPKWKTAGLNKSTHSSIHYKALKRGGKKNLVRIRTTCLKMNRTQPAKAGGKTHRRLALRCYRLQLALSIEVEPVPALTQTAQCCIGARKAGLNRTHASYQL